MHACRKPSWSDMSLLNLRRRKVDRDKTSLSHLLTKTLECKKILIKLTPGSSLIQGFQTSDLGAHTLLLQPIGLLWHPEYSQIKTLRLVIRVDNMENGTKKVGTGTLGGMWCVSQAGFWQTAAEPKAKCQAGSQLCKANSTEKRVPLSSRQWRSVKGVWVGGRNMKLLLGKPPLNLKPEIPGKKTTMASSWSFAKYFFMLSLWPQQERVCCERL